MPGIGKVAAEKLRGDKAGDSGVDTTYQLIGKFLTLKGKGMTPNEVSSCHIIKRDSAYLTWPTDSTWMLSGTTSL